MVSIQTLMELPLQKRSPADLIAMIGCAIKLEHATLPPYLCAMWSIQDIKHEAHKILYSIVMEEMGHMGLACNLLTAIGGTPQLTTKDFVLSYPCPLPCSIVPRVTPPNLHTWTVGLSRLTPALVSDVFMIIEYPAKGPMALQQVQGQRFRTIGEFYDAIAETLIFLVDIGAVCITGDRQITESITENNAVAPITSLKKALRAIEHIKEQGEGTPHSPDAPDFGHELAHYYKFKQIDVGRLYQQIGGGAWELSGSFIDFPVVYPMADIPSGGYQGTGVPPEINAFNQAYGQLLNALQAAWEVGGDQGYEKLQDAEDLMDNLGGLAITLMKTRIDPAHPEKGNYGPTFRIS
jgi:Ferritin-like